MMTYTEQYKMKNGVEINIFLNVYLEDKYTCVAAYIEDTCVFEKKVHCIYTMTNDLPKYVVDAIIDTIVAAYTGCSLEESVDCKFM